MKENNYLLKLHNNKLEDLFLKKIGIPKIIIGNKMYLNLFFLFLDGFSINKYEIVENSTIKNIKKIFL